MTATIQDDPRVRFLEMLAKALAPLGQTSSELEDQLTACARGLGLTVRFLTLPTSVLFTYRDDSQTGVDLVPVREGSVDLETLALLQQIAVDVGKGRVTPAEGARHIETLIAHPKQFPAILQILAGGLAAFAFALLLGGGWREASAAVPCGIAVGAFMLVGARIRRLQNLLEVLATAFATCIAFLLAHAMHGFDSSAVILAAVVLLLPGLRITIGVSELAGGHLASGSSRLAGAVMSLINLGIGIAAVTVLFQKLDYLPQQINARGTSTGLQIAAVVAAALAYTVVQNARRRDVAWVFIAVAIAVVGSRLGAKALGATLGVGIASLSVGLAGNLYSRYLHHPKSTITVPGLTVLVPGALGLEGAITLISGGAAQGAQLLVNAVLLAAGLVVGLMIAESIVPPRTLPERVDTGDALSLDDVAPLAAADEAATPQHADGADRSGHADEAAAGRPQAVAVPAGDSPQAQETAVPAGGSPQPQ